MQMKFILIISCAFVVCLYATQPIWTRPSKVHVSAFAVNDYSNYPPAVASSLSRSIITKNTFVASLFSELDMA